MPLYENGQYHALFIGDMHPVKLMDGNKVIFEPEEVGVSGDILIVPNTYNDSTYLKIFGKTVGGNSVSNFDAISAGKNLFDQSQHNLIRNYNTPEVTVPVKLSPGTYRFSCDIVSMENITYSTTGALLLIRVTYQDNTTASLQVAATSSSLGRTSAGFTTTQPIKALAFYQNARWTGGTITLADCQLERGSSATTYTPFRGMSYVNLPYTLADGDYIEIDNEAKTTTLFVGGTPTPLTYQEIESFYPFTQIYTNAVIQPTLEAKLRTF